MSYRLQIRLAAEADVAEAAQWYDQRQPDGGRWRLSHSIERLLSIRVLVSRAIAVCDPPVLEVSAQKLEALKRDLERGLGKQGQLRHFK
jgi:hypothetical protein